MLTTLCYSFLMKFYVPLPMQHGQPPPASGMNDMGSKNPGMGGMAQESIFSLHVLGMWLGFVLSAAIIAWFVVRMAQAVRQRDETLARVREEILRNERIVALGTQAASAAHEMGTPLSTMAVVIGELKNDVTDTQPALHESLAILYEQVRACKRILDKIMANAQDSGAALPRTADALMAELLDEWQLLRPAAEYHYRCSGIQPPPFLNADVTLRAALMNLLNNAADASPQSIEIDARWNSSNFTLEIRDHGKGLSDEAALKAGSAFFTTKKEGRGLGLLLANATIERMGGTVRLFNREEGAQQPNLPCLSSPDRQPGQAHDPSEQMIAPREEIASLLLVDDDATFCRVLSAALEKRGFAVTVAHSVEEAIPLAEASSPEFAVVDLKMGGAPGLVLVKVLHGLDPNTRIVVLTGYASIATAVEAIKLGATQYLSKPANADEIVAAFDHAPDGNAPLKAQPAQIERLEWEHIQRVLQEHEGNISATARALNMHRRTLQRKLAKPPLRIA